MKEENKKAGLNCYHTVKQILRLIEDEIFAFIAITTSHRLMIYHDFYLLHIIKFFENGKEKKI